MDIEALSSASDILVRAQSFVMQSMRHTKKQGDDPHNEGIGPWQLRPCDNACFRFRESEGAHALASRLRADINPIIANYQEAIRISIRQLLAEETPDSRAINERIGWIQSTNGDMVCVQKADLYTVVVLDAGWVMHFAGDAYDELGRTQDALEAAMQKIMAPFIKDATEQMKAVLG